jgi:hypothetical protein
MEKTDKNYRDDIDFEGLVLPIGTLIHELDMEAFAAQLAEVHYPINKYDHYSYPGRTSLLGMEILHDSRNYRSQARHRLILQEEPSIEKHKRAFWAKELRSAANSIKYNTGLITAEKGCFYLTSNGVIWRNTSTIDEWKEKNIIARIIGSTPVTFWDRQSLEKIGSIWADIDWFNDAYQRFIDFEPQPRPSNELGNIAGLPMLTLQQIALLYAYEGKAIPKADANEIAREYGHKSGGKLYDHYRTVCQRAGRVGDEIRGQRLVPMIKNIKVVVPYLTGIQQRQAEIELQTLEARR